MLAMFIRNDFDKIDLLPFFSPLRAWLLILYVRLHSTRHYFIIIIIIIITTIIAITILLLLKFSLLLLLLLLL